MVKEGALGGRVQLMAAVDIGVDGRMTGRFTPSGCSGRGTGGRPDCPRAATPRETGQLIVTREASRLDPSQRFPPSPAVPISSTRATSARTDDPPSPGVRRVSW